MTNYHIIDSGQNGYNMSYPTKGDKHTLVIRHNAGFFSCSTIALQDIVIWSREHKRLPDEVDRHQQYMHYKHGHSSLIGHFFNEQPEDIDCKEWFELSYDKDYELQFSDYKLLDFDKCKLFVDKYFTPSQYVLDIVKMYEEKNQIDYENTCAVFYRGNDKNKEMKVAPYEMFIDKAKEVYDNMYLPFGGDGLKFLVQPDECSFYESFIQSHPNSFKFEETPCIDNKDSAVFFETPIPERADYAARFLAAVICLSKCKHLITHSGNCGLWAVLYRGNMNNVHQIRDNVWL